jgi:hypothetical protein
MIITSIIPVLRVIPTHHCSRIAKGRGLKEQVSRFEGEQEGEAAGEIFAPVGKTAASNNERLFKLPVKLGRKLGIDKLGQGFGLDGNEIFGLRQYIIKSRIHIM